jgi:hypothetical protein
MTSDSRSVGEQVKSGFLIAGELVGGFLTFIMATVGIVRLYSQAPSRHFFGPLTAWIELSVAIVIIFATAERWGGFIPGFFLLRGVIGGAIYTIYPFAPNAHSQGVTRLEGLALAIYSVAVVALLWRFIPPRRFQATVLDRTVLTIYALSVASMWALPRPTAMRAPLVGSIPLLIAWVAYRGRHTHHRRKLSHHQFGPKVLISRVGG